MAEKVRKTIEYDKDNFDWLMEHYEGQHWWIINALLSEFRQAVGEDIPLKYIRLGAKELRMKLEFDPEDIKNAD